MTTQQNAGARAPTVQDPAQTLDGRLLRATTPQEVADILLEGYGGVDRRACVLWSTQWPKAIESHPTGSSAGITAARRALAATRAGHASPPDTRVLWDDGDHQGAVLYCPGDSGSIRPEALAAAGTRLAEVVSMARLQATVARLEQAEKLQRSLYAIADMAGSDLDMPDMLRGLHRIVSDLMYAENFYIALHDKPTDTLNFLYFVDTVDEEGPTPGEPIPMSRIEHGLSWYLIRDRKPLMGAMDQLGQKTSGPLRLHGADSTDWLGVPMMRNGQVQGIVVVQSYQQESCYTTAEMSLLAFVAEHILTALERKQGQEELERRVEERTAQLASANVELTREVGERERGERLQAVLYRIAALASSEGSSENFYRDVHASVGELINAKNFYIALLSDDGATVSFPYVVDEHERNWEPRSFGRGLTEYVLRTGQPQLVDAQRAEALLASGEIESGMMGAPTLVWLGVPLPGPEGPIGAVVVQSYEAGDFYGPRDAELLAFASNQIANSLQRRRSADLLRQANLELEQRVEERTAELRDQIAVRERIELQLKHQVMHDALTGLPNRVYLRDRIDRAISRMRRDGSQSFGLLYVDVDRFKVINDSLGHLVGDQVLQEVARRLGTCVREPDVVARLAGDEFAILIESVQMPETATKVAQRVLRALEAPLQGGDRALQVSASVGIAIVDDRYGSADQILHDADLALYRAKNAGRNRFVLFDEVMHHNAMGVLELEQGLRDALASDQFMPYFQPLVRLEDLQVVGYEALLRWQHPERGVLAPGDFLAVAEESGLIEAIDWRMFRLALECSRELIVDGRFLTLNVSPRLFQREDFDVRLLELVRDLDFDPARLRLEVTEGTLLGDPEAVVAVLKRLREANVEAALDDFGTGYSSLGHVHRFPLKMIKIDRTFVAPFAERGATRSSAVVEAILALGGALDVEIVAEGVETPHQRELLSSMGCVYAQGYLFGRPQPARHWLELASA